MMTKPYKSTTCSEMYRNMGRFKPSTVPSLPRDVYGDSRGIDESPLSIEVPMFDPLKAEARARGIAEAFKEYVALEGVEVRAVCDGEELDAKLLGFEELLCPEPGDE